jgi:hypothetical protein
MRNDSQKLTIDLTDVTLPRASKLYSIRDQRIEHRLQFCG